MTPRLSIATRSRTGRLALAIVLATALVTGTAWRLHASAPATPADGTVEPPAAPPIGRTAALTGRTSYADVVTATTPAVVTIRTTAKARISPTELPLPFGLGTDNGPRRRAQRALGSGVIVSRDGDILTNHHVVDGADTIEVELADGRTLPATLVGADAPSDLALLKVTQADLPVLPIGDSDAVRVGDVVLAIGNPLGVGQTVTMGIISAKGRSTGAGSGTYEDFLQTDAPINHGNSGGALVNLTGELVGINAQILSPGDGNIGIGFAIPSRMARHVMTQLKTQGMVTRAQLGVTVQPVTSDLAAGLGLTEVGGAVVSGVAPGSAAERAGLRRGDVIRRFDGQPVHDFNALRNRVADATPGRPASLEIVRDGHAQRVQVTLDRATTARSGARDGRDSETEHSALGLVVTPLTSDAAARAGLPRDASGLLVRRVQPDSRAADAGLEDGDIILEVNRQPVRTADDVTAAVNRLSGDAPTVVLVRRGDGSDHYVAVKRPRARG